MKQIRRASRVGRTIGAFALGAAAGSLVSLCFAPASGRVTRQRIAKRIRVLGQEAGRRLGRTRKLLTRKAEGLREATAEQLLHAREWVADRVTAGNGRHTTRRRVARHA